MKKYSPVKGFLIVKKIASETIITITTEVLAKIESAHSEDIKDGFYTGASIKFNPKYATELENGYYSVPVNVITYVWTN